MKILYEIFVNFVFLINIDMWLSKFLYDYLFFNIFFYNPFNIKNSFT